jgi:GT2 family glycosyltransferase/glycosyltransferase involved in cell wall biosynthesis
MIFALTRAVFCGKRSMATAHGTSMRTGRTRQVGHEPPGISPADNASVDNADTDLADALAGFFDAEWYLSRYPDVDASTHEPLHHFVHHGAAEGRDPNRFFDGAWYLAHYPDVASSGQLPLLHYLQMGAVELRNPHPRFDAAYYVDRHPEAAANPLLYHLRYGAVRGWPTEKPIAITDYLPTDAAPPAAPHGIAVDVIIPAYRGLAQTQRCILSVLDDPERPPGRVIVVDDRSPERDLSAWLEQLAAMGRIALVRNRRNLGFVASVNIGIATAGNRDVALLNSDTEVPNGWLARLAGHAYATPNVASVSPFSNNATICGYPNIEGGPPALGLATADLDAVCRTVNGGRSVELPTTVGFCMYIRRAALADVGVFDAAAFGRGYGEENDFCLRASSRGWRHLLACDTYVHHEGAVSFGTGASAAAERGMQVLAERYPHYPRLVAQHVKLDAAGPSRIAVTMQLFRRSGLPTILMLAHDLGGGVHRHIGELVARTAGKANCLLLVSAARGAVLSVPALAGHPELALPAERVADLVLVLQSARVARAHIHHLMSMDLDVRSLLHRLNMPFDVTVHDYFAICPQVNLLPWLQDAYCGEPEAALCNACIADRPSHGARDIASWRRGNAWQFIEADRVICPSEDARKRLARYGFAARAIVVPHEPVAGGAWPLVRPPLGRSRRLRVAVLGVLANQKGAIAVTSLAEAANPLELSIHLIGHVERNLPPGLAERIEVTGEYQEAELPALLARVKPHVVWFPAQWPETYSYTLTAAIDAGLPIVASRIGAFPERLAGRPLTWLVDPEASTEEWLATFERVRGELARQRKLPAARPRVAIADFYRDDYVRGPRIRPTDSVVDLRREGRVSVVVIPERFEGGQPTPCAYIRLLQPLDHPAIGGDWAIVLADAEQALAYRADIVATQRYAVPDLAAADALIGHCRDHGMTLLYDLDDDLRHIPRDHPDAEVLRPRSRIVSRMIRGASAVWVSTEALAETMAELRDDIRVVANGLDERLWAALPRPPPPRQGPVRILFMGTATHDGDFAIVESALGRIKDVFGEHVAVDLLGVSSRGGLPDWVNRIGMPVHANASYPGFVNWITQQHWDIGIAPLADTGFNRCKSALKALDYGAIGLPVLASDRDVYRGSLADGPGGWLLPDDEGAWFVALARLVRNAALRRRLGAGAQSAFLRGTLAAQAGERRAAWLSLIRRRSRRSRAAAERETAQVG